MKTLKLIIMPDGKAKSLNPLGKNKPSVEQYRPQSESGYKAFYNHTNEWLEAESQRKSYEVDFDATAIYHFMELNTSNVDFVRFHKRIQFEGTIVEAEIINENTVKIIRIVD